MRAVFEPTWRHSPSVSGRSSLRSVFRGGFTREAAQTVAEATLHDLGNLAAQSLDPA